MNSLAQSLVAANAGIIIFFSGVVTPIIFKSLLPEQAARYLRAFFPRLYTTLFVTTVIAAVAAFDQSTRFTLIAVAGLFLVSLWPITPAINNATDSNKHTKFKVLHTVSVLILLSQLLTFIFLLFRW